MLSLSSLHWLPIWAGLEINLMGFIPILVYSGMSREAESGMKYFIAQALGSGMIMAGSLTSFGLLLTWEMQPTMNSSLGILLLAVGLMLKLGSFPFHFWLPSVMAGISWMSCLLLASWQKLAPLFLLSGVSQVWCPTKPGLAVMILLSAGMSGLVGGIGGLNQTQIRALLAYSSIGHIGWMLMCVTLSQSVLKTYFLIYFIISVCIFAALWHSEKGLYVQAAVSKPEASPGTNAMLTFLLLSLGGMPPLLGFLGKWLAIWSASTSSSILLVIPLLTGSLVSLFYYLALLFSLTLLSGTGLNTKSAITSQPSYSLNLKNNLITWPLHLHTYWPTPLNLMKLSVPAPTTLILILLLNLFGGLLLMSSLPISDFL
uniref:NADH dehydrogenase subunit 2 n=1 Tax=Tristichotrochus unicus TaxID=499927 RepID=UPI00226D1CFC|nr:NADH dehydrogenase subunit 2 [Tristichotrochus unicus]UZN92196.1 NADH dehydrogenase subunit 2 [Tristichotrochus unicus]